MFAQYQASAAIGLRQRYRRSFQRLLPIAVLLASALAFAGCATPPQLLGGFDPSNPRALVPPVSYRSTTPSYVSQRPVAPAPWRQQNDRVAPQPKSDQ